jgi:hypothetical protein
MRFLALTCSVIFHPLILLVVGLLAILKCHPYYQSKFYDEQFYTIAGFIAVNIVLMPFLAVYLLKRFHFIDDMQMSNPKQRTLPYGVIALLLFYTGFNLYKNEFTGLPLMFLTATIACVVLNIIINFKFTISSHSIASGGLLGLFATLTLLQHISVFNWWLIGSILVAGISGWARLSLNAHTEKQVYLGYMLGLAVVMPVCYFFA